MELSLRRGTLLLTRDPIRERPSPASNIILPREGHTVAETGYVHLHEPSGWWLWTREEVLTGKRIVFDKWSPKELVLQGRTFEVAHEAAVLAIIGEET